MAWLETLDPKQPAAPPVETLGPKVWNMMGGRVEWTAMPLIVDLLGVADPEEMVHDLLIVRDHFDRLRAANG